jgi:hypothetical protein
MEYLLAVSLAGNAVLAWYFRKAVRAFAILFADYSELYKAFEKAAKAAGWKKVLEERTAGE